MPIVLDPDKPLIAISIYFVEETKRHGNSVFHFVKSRSDFDDWKSQGYIPEDAIEPDAPRPEKVINKIITHWKTISWKDQNSILSKSLRQTIKQDGTPYQEIDAIAYRDLQLKTCLKRWDLTDEKGKPIDVSAAVIDNLDPAFANELLASFEEVSNPSSEDLKN